MIIRDEGAIGRGKPANDIIDLEQGHRWVGCELAAHNGTAGMVDAI
ncbi:MAG: hypothetical protein ACKVQT_21045 [Burkholderiales bacterium]